jgi:hypothetical protein
MTNDKPIHTFTSHIAGKNAKVSIYPDRVEWSRAGMSAGKVTAGLLTGGLSMLATGVRNKDTEMIPVRAITSVSTKKEMLNTTVNVTASGAVVGFRVSHGEAAKVKETLQRLMLAV